MANNKLEMAAKQAFWIDQALAQLNTQIQELIGDFKGERRLYEAGLLVGVSASLRDSYYRKLGGQLQDMQR